MSNLSSLASLSLGAVFALAALTACNKTNPNFCEGTPDECDGVDAPIDSPPVTCNQNGPDTSCPAENPICVSGACTGLCDANTDCAGRPATEAECHVASGACVQCDEDDRQASPGDEDECPAPALAVCDATTHTCRECRVHNECLSGICDDGRCAPEGEIVFLNTQNSADNNPCTRAQPCLTLNEGIDHVQAMPAVFKYIHLAPSATPYDVRGNNDRADFDNVTVYVLGTGARVRRAVDGHLIEVRGTSDVTIDGLTISNGTNTAGHGILCNSTLTLRNATVASNDGFGITGSSCTLTVTSSTLSTNVRGGMELSGSDLVVSRSTINGNVGGGISLSSGTFQIVNNFIVGNGSLTASSYGGVSLSSTGTTSKLEFNTIALNSSQVGVTDAINCLNPSLTARSNLLIGSLGKAHVTGNCMHTHTLFTPDNMVNGEGNMVIVMQAGYNFTSGTDFHINAPSDAQNRGSSANLEGESLFDIDGQSRTPGGMVDVGADELP